MKDGDVCPETNRVWWYGRWLRRCKTERRFKVCSDCNEPLTAANISTHQPMRCQPCWQVAAEKISNNLAGMIAKAAQAGSGQE